MSHNPNYEPLGPTTVKDVFKTIPELQEDDHNQAHRNFYESTRSVLERATTISRGDNFTQGSPETLPENMTHPFVCNANLGFEFRGIGTSANWNPIINKIQNLTSGGVYFVILDFEMQGETEGREVLGEIIDDSDGITSIASSTSIELLRGDIYLNYQILYNFKAPELSEGKTFTVELFSEDEEALMGLRSITIHRDR